MLLGLFLIITAWTVVPKLPLWYSILLTIFGAIRFVISFSDFDDAVKNCRK